MEYTKEQKFSIQTADGSTVVAEVYNFIYSMGKVVQLELMIDGKIFTCDKEYFDKQKKTEIL